MSERSRGNPYTVDESRPARSGFVVTPNDGADLETFPTRGIYVGGTGNLAVQLEDGDQVTFMALAAGVIHPIAATRVLATGTTATDILGVY